jgi:rod shape-determining protein MreC
MILSDIPSSNQIKIGDTIVTGGMSFYFPKGIPIGLISNYKTNITEGYFEIEVSLFNDFSSLNNVYILDKLDNEQINKLISN